MSLIKKNFSTFRSVNRQNTAYSFYLIFRINKGVGKLQSTSVKVDKFLKLTLNILGSEIKGKKEISFL